MRKAITSCFLAGTLVISASPAFSEEPASGMSRWFRNPFAKSAKTPHQSAVEKSATDEPTMDEPGEEGKAAAGMPRSPNHPSRPAPRATTVRSAEIRSNSERPVQPASTPKRLASPSARSTSAAPTDSRRALPTPRYENQPYENQPLPAASTRRVSPNPTAEADAPPPRSASLVRRKPSTRAARGTLLDDEPTADYPPITPPEATLGRAESPTNDPPRRRFLPLGRTLQPSRSTATESPGVGGAPALDSRLPAPPPDVESETEEPVIDRVPDPARTAPEETTTAETSTEEATTEATPDEMEAVPDLEQVADAVAEEEPTPPTNAPLVEAEDAPTRPADKSTRSGFLPWRPSFFSKPAAPKVEPSLSEPTPATEEVEPRTPARHSKSGRRPAPTRAGAPRTELQVEAGELEEVQVIGDQPPPDEESETESEPAAPRAPKATPRPRTVEREAPVERPATAASDRPSLSQRVKSWWGVK